MLPVSGLRKIALFLVLALGAAGFGLALYELLSPESGTAGTAGAIIVTVSTALLALAAALLLFVRLPEWLFGLLLALILIDAVATAVAGYFLMANLLAAAMVASLVAGLTATLGGRGGRGVPA